MAAEKCIYCSVICDPNRGGDHVIPAAMGEFRNDIRFRRICPDCNNRIGKSEQVLLHCGAEAYFRRVVSPALPPSRQRGRRPVNAAMGARASSYTIDCGDHRLLVVQCKPGDAQRVQGVDQFVIHDSTGHEHFYRLYSGMRPDKVKQDILQMVALPIAGVWLHCDEGRMEEFSGLFHAMWPRAEKHILPGTPGGARPADGRVHFTVNTHYWRSLAKIGFHYYLCHTRRNMRGDEPAFDAIRDFIMNGGDRNRFFRKAAQSFVLPYRGRLPDGRVESPTDWCHVLAADEMSGEVVAYVQLFAGPACEQREHHIVLGRLDTEIVGPTSFVRAHVYLYESPQPRTGRAGTVEEVEVQVEGNRRVLAPRFMTRPRPR